MKILFFSNVFPNPQQPTKGTFNLEMVRALADGHEVRVVSPVPWVDGWKNWFGGKAPVAARFHALVAGFETHYPTFYYPPKILRRFYGSFLWWSVRETIRRLLQTYRPDVVLSYWVHPDGEVAVRVAHALRVPAVVMVGGSDVLLLARETGRRGCIVKVLQQADAVVTASRDLKETITRFGLSPEKVHVAYRGVDTTHFFPAEKSQARSRLGIPDEKGVLLWVGRMVPVKGLDVLLEACRALRDRAIAFRLYLVGDGPLRPVLERQSRTLGLSEAVHFPGPVWHDRLPDWYRAADLTVLPSRSEGVPNVLRESMACGTPFVASRVGGIPEIARESIDRLVAPEDPAALAAGLAAALRESGTPAAAAAGTAGWAEATEELLRILNPLVPGEPVQGLR
jgi:glycosyltransferase involved in cell wall biosynthesis